MSPPSPPISPFSEADDPCTPRDSIAECNRVFINILPHDEFEQLVSKAREQLPVRASDSQLLEEVRDRLASECKRYHIGANLALEPLLPSTSRKSVETRWHIRALRKEMMGSALFDVFCQRSGEDFWQAVAAAHTRKPKARKKAPSRTIRRSERLLEVERGRVSKMKSKEEGPRPKQKPPSRRNR